MFFHNWHFADVNSFADVSNNLLLLALAIDAIGFETMETINCFIILLKLKC